MEACGKFATSDREAPTWVVVKGVSDYADEKRDDEIKRTRPIALPKGRSLFSTHCYTSKPEAG